MHDFAKATAPKSCIRTIIWKNSARNWKYLERAHDFQAGSPPKSCENGRYACFPKGQRQENMHIIHNMITRSAPKNLICKYNLEKGIDIKTLKNL